ncbi:hypothetical protein FRB99_009043 [Tulasnella sp. 403]|nr:hypothetical protein FRB99_009043 [Tulasnella sp. 403]
MVSADIVDEADVLRLFRTTVSQFGRLDLLFNNAGVAGAAEGIDEISLDNFTSVINLNLTAAALCAREAFKIFKSQNPPGGRIINNGSLAAYTPRPLAVAYTVSKHAIAGLTKSIELEGRNFNITATQLDVGNAATDMASRHGVSALQADGTRRPEPLMDVTHVANAVSHIASLPNEVTLLDLVLLPVGMPFVGRG